MPLSGVSLSPGQSFRKITVTFSVNVTADTSVEFRFSSDTDSSIRKRETVNVSPSTAVYSVELTLGSSVTSDDIVNLEFNGTADVSISSATVIIQ